ncbi:hypothetical protein [uncultured Arthrobacter sp.]|uniref:hypothetical protein n=1 Tax=uncultured Arthrobacter sp. TaxID=114050 RepID=UPI0028D2784D|nr:hypothetical protein [uncultured Arthrobacter sp.]
MDESAYTTKLIDNSRQFDGLQGHWHHKVGNASSQDKFCLPSDDGASAEKVVTT